MYNVHHSLYKFRDLNLFSSKTLEKKFGINNYCCSFFGCSSEVEEFKSLNNFFSVSTSIIYYPLVVSRKDSKIGPLKHSFREMGKNSANENKREKFSAFSCINVTRFLTVYPRCVHCAYISFQHIIIFLLFFTERQFRQKLK